ncbi:NAD(P)-dependent oxidoreductase [Microbulbifer flavimaris]|uniref:NAD(P)-dependent oxidoreductase n=1 Tax=Microbulbifer flavimaris TaxID=1781068 RepID=A0ABX4HZN0_9GAMM|nr:MULTISPECIES: SDR family oxidoreductase [Microbulbifer]KUJ83451.1 short-chain dehydrogenase [Microbulbifer sp. ZGT114]PCO05607.1 NAD(P)-dependent oxidoreductase [Microbulbifer flavimaris]
MTSKVMLITGASSGIGRATALKAAREGLQLVLTARSAAPLESLVQEIGADKAFSLTSDVSKFDEQSKVVEQAIDRFGRLDAVFANAGTGVDQPGTENGDPEEWRQMLDVNIMGLLWTAKLTLPHLRATKGHFIMTGSQAGRIALKGSIYGASKWFVRGFGANLAEEMAEWDGRCTVIAPGMVNTEFFDEPKPDKLDPQDVADAVLFAINAEPRCNVREIFLTPTF